MSAPLISSLVRSEALSARLPPAPLVRRLEQPASGDIVLCTVLDEYGPYPALETAPDGLERALRPGDELFAVLGDRESSINPTGTVPPGPLCSGQILHMLAAAGLAGSAEFVPGVANGLARSLRFEGAPSSSCGRPINIGDDPPLPRLPFQSNLPWIVVCGSSAEVGKTTLAERLIRHFCDAGVKIAGMKIAGTGRMRDRSRYDAAGAAWTADFVDAGCASTYGIPDERLADMVARLASGAERGECDAIVAELGGDLLEGGTPFLSRYLAAQGARFAFIAHDAMGAALALQLLHGYDVATIMRGGNLRAVERRLRVDRVYDVDDPRDIGALGERLFWSKAQSRRAMSNSSKSG